MAPEEMEHLVRMARRGDLRACGRLVEATQAMAYAVARRVLRDPELARDAVQETYLRALRRCFLDHATTDVPVLDEQEARWTPDQRQALARALVALERGSRR